MQIYLLEMIQTILVNLKEKTMNGVIEGDCVPHVFS